MDNSRLLQVTRYPNALHRSFKTRKEAEEWLACNAHMLSQKNPLLMLPQRIHS